MRLLFWLVILFSTPAYGQSPPSLSPDLRQPKSTLYKIAIIDTGYDPTRATAELKLCMTGHWDFFTDTPNLNYMNIHGTRVASLIADKLKDVNYCALIYQLQTDRNRTSVEEEHIAQAINMAINEGAIAINISLSGFSYTEEELAAIKRAEKFGVYIFVAAGNNNRNLDVTCDVYPACHSSEAIVVVGAQDYENPKVRASNSNYGKRVIDIWAPGYYYEGDEIVDFGTSFAAPRALAEFILFLVSKEQ